MEQGQLAEAINCYRQALRINPNFAQAHKNLGAALMDQGRLDEAIACMQRAVKITPDNAGFHSCLLGNLNYHPRYDARAAIFEESQAAGNWCCHAQPLAQFIQPHGNDRAPERRLRIGYVSPDFRNHVDSFFTIPLSDKATITGSSKSSAMPMWRSPTP